VKISEEQQEA